MAQHNKGPITLQAGGALSRYRRVRISGTTLAYAGICDLDSLGTIERDTFASADNVGVLPNDFDGSRIMVASGAVTAWNPVYAAASGKIAATGFVCVGIAKEAATADGDIIEVMPLGQPIDCISAVAATGSAQGDAAALTGSVNTVSAADATKGVILPTPVTGTRILIKNTVAAVLNVYPATGGAINAGSANEAFSVPASTSVLLVATSATQWYSLPLLPS